jgi:hypothetical protein
MANTAYKVKELATGETSLSLSEIKAAYPEPLKGDYWEADLASLDHPFVRSRRLVCSQHTGGSNGWLTDNTGDGGMVQKHPHPTTWRTIMRTKTTLSPGSALVFRVICIESGETETFYPSDGKWYFHGAKGSIRLNASYLNLANQTTTASFTKVLPAAEDGLEYTGTGEAWNQIQCLCVLGFTHPAETTNNPSELSKWSEWPVVELEIQHQGGARIVHASVWEVPHTHSVGHLVEESSIHGWSPKGLPMARPQIEDVDGVTFEEHRFGSLRGFNAAYRQSQRLGPHVANWSAYSEKLTEVGDSENDPIQVTSTSWVGVSVGSAITSWSSSAPGFAIHAPPNGRVPENLHTRLRIDADSDGEKYAAAIPVRCGVYARFTVGAGDFGYVKFQSSPRSMVIVPIAQVATYAWYEATGWLEASSSGLDFYPNLMDFAKVDSGTMEIRDWYVDYGDYIT